MTKIDYNAMSDISNHAPHVWPSTETSVTAGPLITMINDLFGRNGPLASYTLNGIEHGGGPLYIVDVAYGWQPGVKKAVESIINQAIRENLHLAGWKIEVRDNSNLELPQMHR